MRVELDIFSGRPNPGWGIAGTQREEFLEALRALSESTAKPPANEGLGYRGFIVTGVDAAEVDRVTAYRGYVTTQTGGRSMTLLDPDRNLEQRLLEAGREYLDQSLYTMMLRELRR